MSCSRIDEDKEMTKNELFEKYKISTRTGLDRIYIMDFSEKPYIMEWCTPINLVMPDKKIFITRSWVELIKELTLYLQMEYPIPADVLLNFSVGWSKASIFGTKKRVNWHLIDKGLFINCNHTALHSFWLIGDLLSLYGINTKETIVRVHKGSVVEPEEVKSFIAKEMQNKYINFLVENKEMPLDKATTISNYILSFNKIVIKISPSTDNLYLVDSSMGFSGLKSKFFLDLGKYVSWPDNKIKTAKAILDSFSAFLKEQEK